MRTLRPIILALVCGLPTFAPAQDPGPTTRFESVTVKPGDTLWGIAETYLKNPAEWGQILKYNTLPSSDPTVALPGMRLRVPVALMKDLRAAGHLASVVNEVLLRRKETADWTTAVVGEALDIEDALRTLDDSKARVKFINAALLDLEPNSMAIIIPPRGRQDRISLKKGGLFIGRADVVTAAAVIIPKTKRTIYSAKVQEDASTLVRVYSGVASVLAQGQSIDLSEGMETTVPPGLAPGLPRKIPDWPEFKRQAEAAMTLSGGIVASGPAAGPNGSAVLSAGQASSGRLAAGPKAASSSPGASVFGGGAAGNDIQAEVRQLAVGMPISGYRVQASIGSDFRSPVFDQVFDADDKIDIQNLGLKAGVYWWRVATIDLLGTQGNFTEPRQYAVNP